MTLTDWRVSNQYGNDDDYVQSNRDAGKSDKGENSCVLACSSLLGEYTSNSRHSAPVVYLISVY